MKVTRLTREKLEARRWARDIVAVKRQHDAMKGLPEPSRTLACASCGSTILVTARLIREVKHPECVACGGDLVAE